ncbi:MAG: hypothetical protein AUH80_04135 [Chloroflexi bacterium 13_1_40CM_4_65_16]|nr:MAG: hypothetical protein AUH80_04135 [Chloroflexi bacterium 13_1_40CM_4_65_16]
MSDDPADYVVVMSAADLPEGQIKRITVPGHPDAERILLRIGDRICALSATCTHEGENLGEAVLAGETIYCPAHNSGFNVLTGSVTKPPADEPSEID